MDRRTVFGLLATTLVVAACGGDGAPGGGSGTAATGDAQAIAGTALAKAPKRAGEVLVQGDLSPASHGPFTLDGRYTARFEQIAPEDPNLDFTAQTAFVATLDRKPEQEGSGTVRLFRDADRTGHAVVTAHGRYYIDVSFGDFPYAIRLTPVDRG
jgi:hypothetical protein